ncbi:MAG: hypothetical protein AVDCRST_MAG96-150 [uncultured Segetibacter sp.]|uniref:Uncharacterized protein n=1 Tax=uncultured Segetibacter sp. TaxID=481133 RepID=A0A6J4R970_9BACT|nr:MAG: hypothetical protein AVDCRST_MAG96-150 [uncultured Segetibacter sp.]
MHFYCPSIETKTDTTACILCYLCFRCQQFFPGSGQLVKSQV